MGQWPSIVILLQSIATHTRPIFRWFGIRSCANVINFPSCVLCRHGFRGSVAMRTLPTQPITLIYGVSTGLCPLLFRNAGSEAAAHDQKERDCDHDKGRSIADTGVERRPDWSRQRRIDHAFAAQRQ